MAEVPHHYLVERRRHCQIAAMISSLHQSNEHLTKQVTDLQAFSTEQVERIRLLQSEVATLQRLNTLLEGR